MFSELSPETFGGSLFIFSTHDSEHIFYRTYSSDMFKNELGAMCLSLNVLEFQLAHEIGMIQCQSLNNVFVVNMVPSIRTRPPSLEQLETDNSKTSELS